MRYPARSLSGVPLLLEVGASQESVAFPGPLLALGVAVVPPVPGPGSRHPANSVPRTMQVPAHLNFLSSTQTPTRCNGAPAMRPIEGKLRPAQAKPWQLLTT